jgi:hypothetical protein
VRGTDFARNSRVTPVSIDDIDLASLAELLRVQLGSSLETSYLRGKTLLRDTLTAHLGCSDAEAESLVDTLELQGYVRFPHFQDDTHPSGRRFWHISHAPSAS